MKWKQKNPITSESFKHILFPLCIGILLLKYNDRILLLFYWNPYNLLLYNEQLV